MKAYWRSLCLVLAASASDGAAMAAASSANEKPCLALSRTATALSAQDVYQLNALLISASRSGCVELATQLLKAGAVIEARDRFGASPLSRAAEAGQDAVVKLLLEAKADINARAVSGSTPLLLAAQTGRAATVRLLLAHGADPNLPGHSGLRPLAAAAFSGEADMIDALLGAGADANAIDESGKAAIIYAASKGLGAIVRALAKAGVDLNRRYDHGLTALMWAAGYADDAGIEDIKDVVGFLLEKGVALNDMDDRGKSALAIARELHHAEIVEMLLARGAIDEAAQSPAK